MTDQFSPVFDGPTFPLSVSDLSPPPPQRTGLDGDQTPRSSKHPLPPASLHRCHWQQTRQMFASPYPRQVTLSHSHSSTLSIRYIRPRGLRIMTCLKPWVPLIFYAITSLAFIFAIALWRDQLFARLDQLSHWLRAEEHYGHAVLFGLIFLTTIPPFPLYSTLIILSGYTFGPLLGAIISYFAALTGALVVFLVSRTFLRERISRWLACAPTIRRVVRAIEKRPKLLFLIRLAPYPYNVMNCLLAASPTLSFKTYVLCTALSLFKVIVHTALGASIHSFKDWRASTPSTDGHSGAQGVARLWAVVGIILCVVIFVYLTIVASRAVDEELEDEEGAVGEERVAFLSRADAEAQVDSDRLHMVESSVRTQHLVPLRIEIMPSDFR